MPTVNQYARSIAGRLATAGGTYYLGRAVDSTVQRVERAVLDNFTLNPRGIFNAHPHTPSYNPRLGTDAYRRPHHATSVPSRRVLFAAPNALGLRRSHTRSSTMPYGRYRRKRRITRRFGPKRKYRRTMRNYRKGRRGPGAGSRRGVGFFRRNRAPRSRFIRPYRSVLNRVTHGQRSVHNYSVSRHDANVVETTETEADIIRIDGSNTNAQQLFNIAVIPLKTAIGGDGRESLITRVLSMRVKLTIKIPTPLVGVEQYVKFIIVRSSAAHAVPIWADPTNIDGIFKTATWSSQRNPNSRRRWTIVKEGRQRIGWIDGIRQTTRVAFDFNLGPQRLVWLDTTTTPTASNANTILRKGNMHMMIRYFDNVGVAATTNIPKHTITVRVVFNPKH